MGGENVCENCVDFPDRVFIVVYDVVDRRISVTHYSPKPADIVHTVFTHVFTLVFTPSFDNTIRTSFHTLDMRVA